MSTSATNMACVYGQAFFTAMSSDRRMNIVSPTAADVIALSASIVRQIHATLKMALNAVSRTIASSGTRCLS